MVIKKLEKMEQVVSNNKNLSWIGWDVVDRKKSDAGRTSVNGVRINGEWYLQRFYRVSRNGWDIPNKYSKG